MVDQLKQDECYKALQCLYIAVDGAVANDVNYKVKAYLMELESRVKELEAEAANYSNHAVKHIATLEAELSTLRAERDNLNIEISALANTITLGRDDYNALRADNERLVEALKLYVSQDECAYGNGEKCDGWNDGGSPCPYHVAKAALAAVKGGR